MQICFRNWKLQQTTYIAAICTEFRNTEGKQWRIHNLYRFCYRSQAKQFRTPKKKRKKRNWEVSDHSCQYFMQTKWHKANHKKYLFSVYKSRLQTRESQDIGNLGQNFQVHIMSHTLGFQDHIACVVRKVPRTNVQIFYLSSGFFHVSMSLDQSSRASKCIKPWIRLPFFQGPSSAQLSISCLFLLFHFQEKNYSVQFTTMGRWTMQESSTILLPKEHLL